MTSTTAKADSTLTEAVKNAKAGNVAKNVKATKAVKVGKPLKAAAGKIHGAKIAAKMTGSPETWAFGFLRGGPMDIINRTRAGLPSSDLVAITETLGIPRVRFIENMGLRRSTIEDRIKKGKALTPAESETVLRAAKVLARATEVLEDDAAAKHWMKREIRSIGGVTPLSLLDTETGYELVLDTLGRIEHGIAA